MDTGFTDHLPSGAGLFSFTTIDELLDGMRAITEDPARHGEAARALAEAYFDSRAALPALLSAVGVS